MLRAFYQSDQRVSAGNAPRYYQAVPRFDPGREQHKLLHDGRYPFDQNYTLSYYYYASNGNFVESYIPEKRCTSRMTVGLGNERPPPFSRR